MTFDIDREAHAVYDDALRLSRILTAKGRTSGVLCRGCDKPVTVVYHEDRLYSVHCPRCGIVALVVADSPEHAARMAAND